MTNPFTELSEKLAEINNNLDKLIKVVGPPPPDFISIDQASELLNLSKSTIYKRTMTGSIPFYKYRKKLKFSRLELIKWIMDHKDGKGL